MMFILPQNRLSVLGTLKESGVHVSENGSLPRQAWLFPNLYDLVMLTQEQGFAEVDQWASDWRAGLGSADG